MDRLRAVLAQPRAAGTASVRLPDRWLASLLVVAVALECLLRADVENRAVAAGVGIAIAPLVALRRRSPALAAVGAFTTITAVDLALVTAGSSPVDLATLVYLLLFPYALFRWGSGKEAVVGLAVVLAAAITALVLDWSGPGEAIGGLGVLTSSFVLGWATRSQHQARERWAAQVKARERLLLARELHDTVAHHVSAIAIRAQAGRAVAARDPSASLEALRVIELEAKRTLVEMRSMVRMLRSEEPADYAPQAGVADLARIAEAATAGPRVRVRVPVDGPRSGGLDDLPASVDAALFRIAREAITNAQRHARGATLIEVGVDADPSTVRLVVRDDGGTVSAASQPSQGFGITGMIERAALLGGSCSAGPAPGGGWIVEASLPRAVET